MLILNLGVDLIDRRFTFVYMYMRRSVSINHMCECGWKPEEGIRFPWNWSYGVAGPQMWGLRTEPGPSGRASSVLNGVPSLQPQCGGIENIFHLLLEFRSVANIYVLDLHLAA